MTAWKARAEQLESDLAELREAMGDVRLMQCSGHIPVEWMELPNARIGIDANGYVSEIQFINEQAQVIE